MAIIDRQSCGEWDVRSSGVQVGTTFSQRLGLRKKIHAVKTAGALEGVRYIKHQLTDRVATHLIERWDSKHGVDTGGRIPVNPVDIEVSGSHARSAYDIVSTPPSVFAHVSKFFPTPRADYSYLDIGSGKGRTVLLASELGFQACIGVEFAKFACDVARKNFERYVSKNSHRSPCTVVNSCATKCTFPDGDLVLFFNNPFSLEIWTEMAQRLSSLAEQNRAITVILIGSFPDTIRGAATLIIQSGAFGMRAKGITLRFWDSYAPFHFIVFENRR